MQVRPETAFQQLDAGEVEIIAHWVLISVKISLVPYQRNSEFDVTYPHPFFYLI